jgi:hypothetical protein
MKRREFFAATLGAAGALSAKPAQGVLHLSTEASPLAVFLGDASCELPTEEPRFEWFESDYIPAWGVNGSRLVAADPGDNEFTVEDGSVFSAGDICCVPVGLDEEKTAELFGVIAVWRDVLIVQRAINGIDAIGEISPGGRIRILGTGLPIAPEEES